MCLVLLLQFMLLCLFTNWLVQQVATTIPVRYILHYVVWGKVLRIWNVRITFVDLILGTVSLVSNGTTVRFSCGDAVSNGSVRISWSYLWWNLPCRNMTFPVGLLREYITYQGTDGLLDCLSCLSVRLLGESDDVTQRSADLLCWRR